MKKYIQVISGRCCPKNILEQYQENEVISKNLIICKFNKVITRQMLDDYLVDSNEEDIIVNTLDNIDFFSVFNTPNYTVKLEIYDFVTELIPNFNKVQLNNISKIYKYSSYRGINTSKIWRIAIGNKVLFFSSIHKQNRL